MANENDAWWERLKSEVEAARKAKRSMREISLSADLGENYVEQLVKKNATTPRAEIILRLCRVLGLSPAYIFTGIQMTPEAEELLVRWQNISPAARKSILRVMEEMPSKTQPPTGGPPQAQSSDSQ